MSYKIIDPEFVDLQKTHVRFKIVADGVIQAAELKVPPNQERGINAYWDRILDEFDIQKMREDRNNKEIRDRKAREVEDKRRKGGIENQRLKELFQVKIKAFELPYINNTDDEVKAAIRRAPSMELLNLILNELAIKFMKENSMSYLDYIDYLDDLEEQKEIAKENSTTTEPT